MDPNRCLQELMCLLFEAEDRDREAIVTKMRDLSSWIESGGFFPKVIMGENRFSDDEQTGHLVVFGG